MITDKQIEKYRNAECEICRGEGVLVDWDWVPYGSTNVRMETSEVCECVTNAMDLEEEVFDYLDALRDSGITNMYGAGAYVETEFGLDRRESKKLLMEWMETYSERH